MDGKRSIFEHSNMTVTVKSEIALNISRIFLGMYKWQYTLKYTNEDHMMTD